MEIRLVIKVGAVSCNLNKKCKIQINFGKYASAARIHYHKGAPCIRGTKANGTCSGAA